MKRNGYNLICLVFAFMTLILLSVTLFSSGATVYGPRKFIRDKGKPVVVTEKFSAPSAKDSYRLIVFNGENGKNRVSSATLKINGKEILRERDFNQQFGKIERDINLQTSNTIAVELKSAPGSSIIVSILLESKNYPPTAEAGPDQTIHVGDTVQFDGRNSTDVDGDDLTFQWSFTSIPPGSGATLSDPKVVTPTFFVDRVGTYIVQLIVNDGKADSFPDSVVITTANSAPAAMDQSMITNENSARAITLIATDRDGDALTYQIVTQPAHGTLSGTPPNLTYTPPAHYFGSDTFTFKANDGNADSNVAAASITVNRPPVAQDQCVTTDEDTAKAINLLATDAEGNPLTYTIVTQPGHGTLNGTPPTMTYTPAAHYFGRDSFTFKVNDGNADSNAATVSITVTPTGGIITTVAGDGLIAYSGDGGPAAEAMLFFPFGVTVDGSGNLYIADTGNYRIRKVDKNGIITTVAGNGVPGYSGDGGPANEAMLNQPQGLAVDASGNLYIADSWNHRIRKVDPNGIITTVAGNGLQGYGGDGGPPTGAILDTPIGVAVAASGELYIADSNNHRIRKAATNGIIITVAGNGSAGYGGDGGPATEAMLHRPQGLAIDGSDNLYVADTMNYRIRKVGANGIIMTAAGAGTTECSDFTGDGGLATSACLWNPSWVAVDTSGNLYIADGTGGSYYFQGRGIGIAAHSYIRKVDTSGVITPFAGGHYLAGYSGDGGPANEASLSKPQGMAVDLSGNVYIADSWNHRIRKVDPDGFIATAAGNGMMGAGDGGPATEANLVLGYYVWYLAVNNGLAIDTSGNLYIADSGDHRVRKVDSCGIITTVAGNGTSGFSGDGGPATQAEFSFPAGLAVDASGNLYIADRWNDRIRKVDTNGIVTTVAGGGIPILGVGDGGLATQAILNIAGGLATDGFGNLYITDSHCVRKVDGQGTITSVAGICGVYGYSGDGGLATLAVLSEPKGVAVDNMGNLYIADTGNLRIRKVDTNGVITTVAGNGYEGYGSDGGPATGAALWRPTGVGVDASGNFYIVDNFASTVRKVDTNGIFTTVAGNVLTAGGYAGDGGPAAQASLYFPTEVSVDALGNLYISDTENYRIRTVWGLPKTATLVGKVTDSTTGLPLANVGVTLTAPLNTPYSTITDSYSFAFGSEAASGFYSLTGLRPGDFTATFENSAYFQLTANVTLTAGQTQTLNIQLIPFPSLNVTITSPLDGATFTSSPVLVEGTMTPNATVTVNGTEASVNNNTFSAPIALHEYGNSITVTATDQYGQTASQTIYVTLSTEGIITGAVTDLLTGLPVESATVSVTDSMISPEGGERFAALFIIIGKTAVTDGDGRYTIYNISPGAFSGTITKEWYETYNFSGTMAPGQTLTMDAALNPILLELPPIINNIIVNEVTTTAAIITWTTDQLADSSVDYGITASYGSQAMDSTLTTNHTITLSNLIPGTTYHFRVTSTNGNGLSSTSGDLTFQTLPPPVAPLITLVITSPSDGSTINIRDMLLKGTVIHSRGSETGVVVNGVLANTHGTEFAANHVPLVEGQNTITATATDIDGNTETASITVNGVPTTDYIRITTSSESGLSPFEATLTLESSLAITNASLTPIGPEQVEILSVNTGQYRVTMTTEGVYYFTASIADSSGKIYTDTLAITVLPKSDLDGLLRAKWEAMKSALSSKDISKGLEGFLESSREIYEQAFSVILDELPQIISDMQDIEVIFLSDNVAKYRISRVHEIDGAPQTITYYIYFVKDFRGLWKIDRF